MNRILRLQALNAGVALLFFGWWYLLNLRHRSGGSVQLIAVLLFLGFFVGSLLPLRKLGLGAAVGLSLISALLWTVFTIFASAFVLVLIFGFPSGWH